MMNTREIAGDPATAQIHLGRLSLGDFKAAKVALQDASIDLVSVRPIRWSTKATARSSGAAAAWSARVHAVELDTTIRPLGERSALILERLLAPNVRVLFRYDSPEFAEARVAEALVDAGGGQGAWLRVAYSTRGEAAVLAALTRIGGAYEGVDSTGPDIHTSTGDVGRPAFHLPGGRVNLRPGFEEHIDALIRAPAQGFEELTISTESQSDPLDHASLIAEWRA